VAAGLRRKLKHTAEVHNKVVGKYRALLKCWQGWCSHLVEKDILKTNSSSLAWNYKGRPANEQKDDSINMGKKNATFVFECVVPSEYLEFSKQLRVYNITTLEKEMDAIADEEQENVLNPNERPARAGKKFATAQEKKENTFRFLLLALGRLQFVDNTDFFGQITDGSATTVVESSGFNPAARARDPNYWKQLSSQLPVGTPEDSSALGKLVAFFLDANRADLYWRACFLNTPAVAADPGPELRALGELRNRLWFCCMVYISKAEYGLLESVLQTVIPLIDTYVFGATEATTWPVTWAFDSELAAIQLITGTKSAASHSKDVKIVLKKSGLSVEHSILVLLQACVEKSGPNYLNHRVPSHPYDIFTHGIAIANPHEENAGNYPARWDVQVYEKATQYYSNVDSLRRKISAGNHPYQQNLPDGTSSVDRLQHLLRLSDVMEDWPDVDGDDSPFILTDDLLGVKFSCARSLFAADAEELTAEKLARAQTEEMATRALESIKQSQWEESEEKKKNNVQKKKKQKTNHHAQKDQDATTVALARLQARHEFSSAEAAGKYFIMVLARDALGEKVAYPPDSDQSYWSKGKFKNPFTTEKTKAASSSKKTKQPSTPQISRKLKQPTLSFSAPKTASRPSAPATSSDVETNTSSTSITRACYLVPMASMMISKGGNRTRRLIAGTVVMHPNPFKNNPGSSFLLDYMMLAAGYAHLLSPDYLKILATHEKRKPRLYLSKQETMAAQIIYSCMRYAEHARQRGPQGKLKVPPFIVRWGVREFNRSTTVKGTLITLLSVPKLTNFFFFFF
jgi:hypothetical protein